MFPYIATNCGLLPTIFITIRITLHLAFTRPYILYLSVSEKNNRYKQTELKKWKERVNTKKIHKSKKQFQANDKRKNFF